MIIISVIVPCYNSEQYLRRCLAGLYANSTSDAEFIFVDDGSTDGTHDILMHQSNVDPRIRVFTKTNGGYCSAVNAALELAKGKYIMFLGSDDEILPNSLDRMIPRLRTVAPDILVFRSKDQFGIDSPKDDKWTTFSNEIYFEGDIWDCELTHPEESQILFHRDTSRLYKKELIGSIRYKGKYGVFSDEVFSLSVEFKCHTFLFVPIDVYIIHFRSDSISGRLFDAPMLEDQFSIMTYFFTQTLQQKNRDFFAGRRSVNIRDLFLKTVYVLLNLGGFVSFAPLIARVKIIGAIQKRYRFNISLKLSVSLKIPVLFWIYVKRYTHRKLKNSHCLEPH